jgi:hypothetical protein
MTTLTFFLLLLPIGAFVIFWKYSMEKKQQSVERLSISISLCLLVMVFIIWIPTSSMDVQDRGKLGFATSFVVLIRLIIKSFPMTAPEAVRFLGLEERPLRKPQPLLASFLVFVYIVFSYLLISLLVFPNYEAFLLNITSQWWVILIAFFISAIRYCYTSRGKEVRSPDQS